MSTPFPVPQRPSDASTPAPVAASDPDTASDAGGGQRRPRRTVDPEVLLAGLNPAQRQAVVHEGSPLLVVAGAGSGKTRVLTRRIAWLVSQSGAHPGSILAITFTNKAAAEMRTRVAELTTPRMAATMWVSTFHSACVRILRKEIERFGYRPSFSIYDDADQRRLMAMVCRELELDPKRYQPRAVLGWISNCKNELHDHDHAAKTAQNPLEETFAEAFGAYQARLRDANALDFDDLIMLTVHLMQAFPEVREAYRRRFRHVLVDEYQDTNHAQYALIRELCAPHAVKHTVDGDVVGAPAGATDDSPGRSGVPRIEPAELMVVGDADQSIYAFRGASIRNILQFERDFPAATTILLEQNYRSTQTILSAANAVISRNQGRKAKNLWSDAGDGERIVGYVADDEHDEARFVAEEIDRLTDAGSARPGDVAVFYRTNAQSRVFEEVFVRVGLPYKVVGGVRFYERREVRDALAYLRLLDNPTDTVSLRRILNVPKRGIGQRAEACVEALAGQERISFWEALRRADEAPALATRSRTAIRGFVQLIEGLQALVADGASADKVLEEALTRSGYLHELEESADPQDETRTENLAELVAVAREFSDEAGDSGASRLGDFLERVALVADADEIPDDDVGDEGGVVTLMTLHTAKGLEFPVVFLTGLEDGVFPHTRSLGDATQLEEERRLAYVGLTRAQRRLYVARAVVRSAWGAPQQNPASRFCDEIPLTLVDWRRTEAAQTSWANTSVSSRYLDDPPLISARRRPTGPAWTGASTVPAAGGTRRAVRSLAPGDRVNHDAFGLGTVVTVTGQGEQAQAAVDFGSRGVKRLLLRFAPIDKL
ncbi:MAG: DNA helicase PcrA [Actinomycetota bacterium]|nr:DNA helicase PcrA [Actinomycetota bacterium]